MRTHRNFKFGKNVHYYLKNQEMLRIIRYFQTFLVFSASFKEDKMVANWLVDGALRSIIF